MSKMVGRAKTEAEVARIDDPPVISAAELHDATWDAYVAGRAAATFSHRLGFVRAIERTFGYEPLLLAARRGGSLCGVLPLFVVPGGLRGRVLVSVPCSDWGGPVADVEHLERVLFQEAVNLGRELAVGHIELRHRKTPVAGPSPRLDKVNMRLELSSAKDAWPGVKSETRNQVRKALREGLEFQVGGTEMLPGFYRVWSTNMRDLGTPAYPLRFFEELLAEFPDDAGVFLVTDDGRPVGAGIFTVFGDEMGVPFVSSLRSCFRKCPNNLLYWGAIREACARGLRYFSFGRSSRGSGTYRFKKGWGAQEEQLYNQFVPICGDARPPRPDDGVYRLATRAWQTLPVWIANRLGPPLAKRFVY